MFSPNIYNNSVSNLTNGKTIINGKEVDYFGNFCKIDQKLIDLIKKYAGERTIVDVGAGKGLLNYLMDGIISIDKSVHYAYGTDKKNIIMDAKDFEFTKEMMPVFLRPCSRIETIIFKNIDIITDFIYVTGKDHYEEDNHIDKYFYDVEELDWHNREEQAYHVTINKEKLIKYKDEYEINKQIYADNKNVVGF